MSGIGKLIINRVSNGRFVAAAATVHKNTVMDGILEEYKRLGLNPPPAAVLEEGLSWLGASLDKASQRLMESETALAAEGADDGPIRAKRDQQIAALIGLLQAIRTMVSIADPSKLAEFGLEKSIPVQPDRLAAYGQYAASRMVLCTDVLQLPAGLHFDAQASAAQLTQQSAELAQTIAELTTESKELVAALEQRDEALATWNSVYQGTALVMEGLLRLSGHPELADRVRPTVARQGGQEGPPEPADDNATVAPPEG